MQFRVDGIHDRRAITPTTWRSTITTAGSGERRWETIAAGSPEPRSGVPGRRRNPWQRGWDGNATREQRRQHQRLLGQRRRHATRQLGSKSEQTNTYTLYSGNYLNWYYGPTAFQTRLQVVQDVTTDLLDSVNGVNTALMYFNDDFNTTSQRKRPRGTCDGEHQHGARADAGRR